MFILEKFLTVLAELVSDPSSMTPDGVSKRIGIDLSTVRTQIFKNGDFAINDPKPGLFGVPLSLVCIVEKRWEIVAVFVDKELPDSLLQEYNFTNQRRAVSKFKLPGYAIEFDFHQLKGIITVSDPPHFIETISIRNC